MTGSASTTVQSVSSTVNQTMQSASKSATATSSASSSQPFNLTAFVHSQILQAKEQGGSVSRIAGPAFPLLARNLALLDPAEIRSFTSSFSCPGGGSMSFSGIATSTTTMTYTNCSMGGMTMSGTMTLSFPNGFPTGNLLSCGSSSYISGKFTSTITYSSFKMTTGTSTSTLNGTMSFSDSETCSSGVLTMNSLETFPTASPFTLTTSTGITTVTGTQTMMMTMGSTTGALPTAFDTYGTLTINNTALDGTPFAGNLTVDIGTSANPWTMDMAVSPPYPTAGSITITATNGNTITITAETGGQVQIVQTVSGTTTTTTEAWSNFA